MYGMRLVMQALYFLLLARWLGVRDFGVFSGVWVLCGFLGTLSGLGFPVLVFRTTVLAASETAGCAARGLRTIAATALPLTGAFVAFAIWKFPDAPAVAILLLLAASEIVLLPMLNLLASVHQAHERLGRSHVIFATLWGIRVAGLLLLDWGWGRPGLPAIVSMHAMVTAIVTAAWLIVERNWLVSPLRVPFPRRDELLTGLYFALSGTALIAYTELNQSIVLAVAGATAAGLLAVAYKVVALLSTPLSALCQAAAPRLVRAAHHDDESFMRLMKALAWPILLYAFVSGFAILLASQLITWVFGASYADAEHLTRQMCILPLFTAVRLLASYVLMATSKQRDRVVAEVTCLVVGLLVNVFLIGRHGLQGAIVAIVLTEALTAFTLGVFSWRMRPRATRAGNA